MTIKIPPMSVADRILRNLGKRRALIFPVGAYEKFGPYVIARAKKEHFLKALLRPKSKQLPPGSVDLFSFCEGLPDGGIFSGH
jgi:hypothetical protein